VEERFDREGDERNLYAAGDDRQVAKRRLAPDARAHLLRASKTGDQQRDE